MNSPKLSINFNQIFSLFQEVPLIFSLPRVIVSHLTMFDLCLKTNKDKIPGILNIGVISGDVSSLGAYRFTHTFTIALIGF